MAARRAIVERIRILDRRVYALAKASRTARLFMSAPGVGAITALSVASAYDDPARFARSASAGAYFGLTPRR
jgi:transposase